MDSKNWGISTRTTKSIILKAGVHPGGGMIVHSGGLSSHISVQAAITEHQRPGGL